MTCCVLWCQACVDKDKSCSEELGIEFRRCGTSDSLVIIQSNISLNESQGHTSAPREPDEGTVCQG